MLACQDRCARSTGVQMYYWPYAMTVGCHCAIKLNKSRSKSKAASSCIELSQVATWHCSGAPSCSQTLVHRNPTNLSQCCPLSPMSQWHSCSQRLVRLVAGGAALGCAETRRQACCAGPADEHELAAGRQLARQLAYCHPCCAVGLPMRLQ